MLIEIPSLKSLAPKSLLLAASIYGLMACNSTTGSDSTAIINVTSPAAGSSWNVGDSLIVKWTVKQDPIKVVDAADILLSADGGQNWTVLNPGSIPPESAKFGNYKWLIPDSLNVIALGHKISLKGAKQCRVKVEEYSTQDPDLMTTTGDFTIN
jgi:hypothetical protein